MAEYPAVLWMLFFGIAIPMILLAGFAYRGLLFYFAVRDSCYKAAKAPSFSAAQNTATTTFNTEVAAWHGISGTEAVDVGVKALTSGTLTYLPGPLAPGSVNTSANIYFIREIGTGSIQPLISTGPFLGMNVPGLSGPFPLTVKYETYVENPQGLTN